MSKSEKQFNQPHNKHVNFAHSPLNLNLPEYKQNSGLFPSIIFKRLLSMEFGPITYNEHEQ